MLREGVAVYDGDLDTEAEALSVLVREAATEGEALNEQDLNNGLHERVTLTVGGLLMLRETEGEGLRDKEGLDDCVCASRGKSASNAPLKENI
jgi:hypothetical protein